MRLRNLNETQYCLLPVEKGGSYPGWGWFESIQEGAEEIVMKNTYIYI